MSKDKGTIGVAVLGAGAWGINHVRVWSEMGYLKCVCDLDAVRLDGIKARFPDVRTTSDPNAVLQDPEIQALVIATPAPTHGALVLQALESGKDVLVEKPMALNSAEGARQVETAGRLKRVLMVGHVLEFHPAVGKLKELIRSGELGRIQYVYSNRLNLGRIRTEENALWSFAPHDVAITLSLLGMEPEEVICHGGAYLNQAVADTTVTNLVFANGVRGHIFVSWLHPFKEHRFVVVGDRHMAVFDDTCPWPEKLVLYRHRVDWMGGQVPVARKAEGSRVALEESEPLRAECEHFLNCCRTRRPPLTGAESGLKVLRVLEAGQRSMEQGGRPQRLAAAAAAPPYYVHPTAIVDQGAEIGEQSRIWHFSHVMAGARIGEKCVLGQNVFVASRVRIGNGVKIQNNVSVYEGVELEDDVFCGPSMVFTNVYNPRAAIERKNEYRPTLVRRGTTIGANATIVCGVTIGQQAFIGAGAVVTEDVPDYALMVGMPARRIGWMCRCGVRLPVDPGLDSWQLHCPACQLAYEGGRESIRQLHEVTTQH